VIDEAIRGFIAGAIGERVFGRWVKRNPRLAAAISIPPLLVVAFLAGRQLLGL
jgi:hypothetical protein